MREFKITQHLLDLALEKANAKQIVRVNLLIGPFSEEREQSIKFYWRDLAKGSFGEGAELHFEHVSFEMKCLNCTGTFFLNEETSMCNFCDRERLQVFSGEDVRLESIVVE